MAGRLGGISAARPSVILALSIAVSLLVVALEYKLRQARLNLQPFS
jgi:hypothetical protein